MLKQTICVILFHFLSCIGFAIVNTNAFQLKPYLDLPFRYKKSMFIHSNEVLFAHGHVNYHEKENYNSINTGQNKPSFIEYTPIISNQGKTATFMLYWPSITTFTLLKNWNGTNTQEFIDAVDEVINKNPILTGRASKRGFLTNDKIIITPGIYPTTKHDFVNIIDLTDLPLFTETAATSLTTMNGTQILHFMDEFISPIVPKAESVIESISNGSPLFGIDLILLADGYACYVVKMSHCVGDGVCYFKIMEQINHCFNNSHKKINDHIDWDNEDISIHEVFPSRFSAKDSQIMYGIPFLIGLLRNIYNMKKQKKRYFLLSKKKINEKRKEYMDLYNATISSNDLITSALCEANSGTDIFAFTKNMRSLHSNYGGNFHNEVPFPKEAVLSKYNDVNLPNTRANPIGFREIIKRGYYYDTDEIPLCPFIFGRVGRISSLASIQKLIKHDDMKLVCHAMLSSFVANVPMDTAFISSMDDDKFVVLHNFRDFNEHASLLKEIAVFVE